MLLGGYEGAMSMVCLWLTSGLPMSPGWHDGNLKQPSHAGQQQTLTRTSLFIGGKYRLILILIPFSALDDTKPFRR